MYVKLLLCVGVYMRNICFVFYRLLLYCAMPFWLLRLLLKTKGNIRLKERLGFYQGQNITGRVIWVHAVSVGETIAASAMAADLAEYKILFSVTTSSGRAKAEALFAGSDNVTVIYSPYDLKSVILRLLTRFDVAMLVSMETEIWPELYLTLAEKNIPILLANARLSAKSCRKYAKFRNFFTDIFASVTWVLAQDKADAKRFTFMGSKRVKVLGSMKYDIKPPVKSAVDLAALSHFARAKTLMAISTHGNEEEILLEAFKEILKKSPGAKLILVPRHPDRVGEIVKLIAGFEYALYSEDCNGSEDILLVDKIGVLGDLFQVFDVAYVGGSLVQRGGQNPIEPAFYAKPVLMGPSRYNFHRITANMSKTGGLILVTGAKDIAQETLRLFKGDMGLGQKLLEHVKEHAGATGRHVELIKSLL